jgi:hypothetical protein
LDTSDVEYKNPQDGKTYVMPLGHLNLQPTSKANLIKLAEYREAQAKEYWELAQMA